MTLLFPPKFYFELKLPTAKMMSGLNYRQHVIEFSVNHGASRFVNEWLSKSSVFIPGNFPPTMIFAPTDASIDRLVASSGRTWEEILNLAEGADILNNHISVKQTQKVWPMFTSINQHEYGRDQNDILALKPVISTTFNLHDRKSLALIIVDAIILHDDQLRKLKSSKVGYSTWQRQPESANNSRVAEANKYSGLDPITVGRDLFGAIIGQGLTGRSLLALCTGNARARELCDRNNQSLFKHLLMDEFNFDWDRAFAKESPRELYAKFHSLRVDVYISGSESAEISGNWALIENGEVNAEVANAVKLQSDRGRSRISVPVEGWFAKNAKIPTAQYTLGQAPITRPNMHFFYVVGRPETATLVRFHLDSEWNPEIDEISNDWFEQYFADKALIVRVDVQNVRHFEGTATGIMKSLISFRNSGDNARVLIDGIEETVVYLKLQSNKL